MLSSRQWLGCTVEDVQEGALRGRHRRVSLICRRDQLCEGSGPEVRGARRPQRLRHHRVLRSQQPEGTQSAELHDGQRRLPPVLHPRDPGGNTGPAEEQVQLSEGRQGVF